MFSPILLTNPCRVVSRDSPLTTVDISSSTEEAAAPPDSNDAAASATLSQYDRNDESFPTKSVSQLISTITALLLPLDLPTAILPSVATREAFLSAFANPF